MACKNDCGFILVILLEVMVWVGDISTPQSKRPHEELNPDLKDRNLVVYPLAYGGSNLRSISAFIKASDDDLMKICIETLFNPSVSLACMNIKTILLTLAVLIATLLTASGALALRAMIMT